MTVSELYKDMLIQTTFNSFFVLCSALIRFVSGAVSSFRKLFYGSDSVRSICLIQATVFSFATVDFNGIVFFRWLFERST